ncbi:MAG: TniQ family protein [Solirubrobacteraceae bacterium]
MRSPDRWPLRPAPIDGEALSSWLLRIASGYQMTVGQLIHHGLGQDQKIEPDLDLDPPPALLDTLAQRTGITTDRVRQMCLAGWTPWLLDNLQAHLAGFDTYVRQFSVLLKPGKRSKHRPGRWVGWIPRDRVQRACPGCMEDPTSQRPPGRSRRDPRPAGCRGHRQPLRAHERISGPFWVGWIV